MEAFLRFDGINMLQGDNLLEGEAMLLPINSFLTSMSKQNLAEIDAVDQMEICNFYEYTSDHRFSNILHSPKRDQFASLKMEELSGSEEIETPVQ